MVEKWGDNILEPITLWHKLTQEKFPLAGTFSSSKLRACRDTLEQYERKAGVKAKDLKWDWFRKWEREAEFRDEKQARALLSKEESGDEKRHKRLKKYRQEMLQPPPYRIQLNPPPADPHALALAPPGHDLLQQAVHPPAAAADLPAQDDPPPPNPGGLYAAAVQITQQAALGTEEVENSNMDLATARLTEQVGKLNIAPTKGGGSSELGMTTRSMAKQLQMPLIPYPNPHPPPPADAQQDVRDAYNPTVTVQRNWTPDELNDIMKDLPNPKVEVEKWCKAIEELILMYAPSGQELETLFRKVFGLRWQRLKGPFDADGARQDILTGQLQNDDGLFARVRAAFPVRTDWPRIHNTKQRLDESCDEYRSRMEEIFQKCCGVTQDNVAYNDLLKTAMINNLTPAVHDRVMISCVGWETQPLDVAWSHAQHAERQLLSQINEKKKKLETAQLMFYENRGQAPRKEQQMTDATPRWPQEKRERGMPLPGDICGLCQKRGHWRRQCPINAKRRRTDGQQVRQGNNRHQGQWGWQGGQPATWGYPSPPGPCYPGQWIWTGTSPNTAAQAGPQDTNRAPQPALPWQYGPAADVTVNNPGQL